MKKKYMPPTFMIHGNVRSLTQAIGRNTADDTLSFSGRVVEDTDGSRDFISP